ncbi:MAG: NlpC/P60 family protein, partial [Lachnospiraceae bacterium]|nr:NlpC/P60 family protein [Lachnospiraceae bacterium]
MKAVKRLEEKRDKAKKKEEEERKKKEEEAKKRAAEQFSNPIASNRAFYSGSYYVSDVQRRLALTVGFKQIPKKYAISEASGIVYIYESQSKDARIVGSMEAGSLCFIIADEDQDWIFVESGDVRGFVQKDMIRTGKAVNKKVKKIGEANMPKAVLLVAAADNAAYRYSTYTTKSVVNLVQGLDGLTIDRQEMVAYSMQFLGNPYVWGGESLTNGTDCSGFTMLIYRQFGINIPHASYEQAELGVKIPVSEAEPGDLVFYARDGAVYHVLMAIGNGQAINASSSTTGIIISNINMEKACWAVKLIPDTAPAVSVAGSTQAASYVDIGKLAYQGDEEARLQIIGVFAQAAQKAWREYGFLPSVTIAQAIQETGWNSFSSNAVGIQAADNNVLGMNEELLNDRWISPWTGGAASRLVPQYSNGGFVYNYESMRTYEDIEACMEDYAAFKTGLHPEIRGVTDVDTVIAVGLKGYATDPTYQDKIRSLIDRYGLTQYDTVEGLNDLGETTVDPDEDVTESDVLPDVTSDVPEIPEGGTDSVEELPDTEEDTDSAEELPDAEE